MNLDIAGMNNDHVDLDNEIQRIHKNESNNKDSQLYRRATKLIEFQRMFFSDENLEKSSFYSELLDVISGLGDSVKQLRLKSSIEFLSSD
jgi:hypothetical protein